MSTHRHSTRARDAGREAFAREEAARAGFRCVDPRLELSLHSVRRLIRSWRMAANFANARDDRLKIQLMTRRGEILAKLVMAAGAWRVLLHECASERTPDLDEIEHELQQFRSWARQELQDLLRLGEEEPVAGE